MGDVDATTVLAAVIGAWSAIAVEALRIYRDSRLREQGRRRTRRSDWTRRNGHGHPEGDG